MFLLTGLDLEHGTLKRPKTNRNFASHCRVFTLHVHCFATCRHGLVLALTVMPSEFAGDAIRQRQIFVILRQTEGSKK